MPQLEQTEVSDPYLRGIAAKTFRMFGRVVDLAVPTQTGDLLNPVLSRRAFLRGTGRVTLGALMAGVALPLLSNEASADECYQSRYYLPFVAQPGQPTIYGSLAYYDGISASEGVPTNFAEIQADFERRYIDYARRMGKSEQYIASLGNCGGGAKSLAKRYYHPDNIIKLGILFALFLGLPKYEPGLDQLIEDFRSSGRHFVVLSEDETGVWDRVVYGINDDGTLKATDYGRGSINLQRSQIGEAFAPLYEWEARNYPMRQVKESPPELRIGLDWDRAMRIIYS